MTDGRLEIDPRGMAALFFSVSGEPGVFLPVPAISLPEPQRSLLDHDHHMTVTVERHHGVPVEVEILQEHHQSGVYAREILLRRQSDRTPVLYGIVRVHLAALPGPAADRILGGRTPLGRILIEHDVLRRVELLGLFRVVAGKRLGELFPGFPPAAGAANHATGREFFGRTAIIHVGSSPAVELLEVVP